jgi:hypothetical protein
VAQVVEHLPSKCETLSSNPGTITHTQKKNILEEEAKSRLYFIVST